METSFIMSSLTAERQFADHDMVQEVGNRAMTLAAESRRRSLERGEAEVAGICGTEDHRVGTMHKNSC